ncbi:hypothetical protein [Streptomyces purpurogeneiscleroticus]|uniref:hypothetical protein n=1 Tax=Streptomyces purpurogeneiscleroticus TaxID=68259 RepID=UPI0035589AEC
MAVGDLEAAPKFGGEAEPDDQRANRRRQSRARGRPPAFDKVQYRRRSAVERCVSQWKHFRAVAARFDERDYVFNGTSPLPRSSSGFVAPYKSHQRRPSLTQCSNGRWSAGPTPFDRVAPSFTVRTRNRLPSRDGRTFVFHNAGK